MCIRDRDADEGVELGYGSLGGVDDLGLVLKEFDHDESGMLINEECGITVAAEE